MSIYAYNATQAFVRATPFLVTGAAVASLYPEEVKDFVYRIAHRPAPPIQPKRVNQWVVFAPLAALLFLGSKFLPELKGAIPRSALENKPKGKAKPKPKTVSPALRARIPKNILSKIEKDEAARRYYIAQYNSPYIYDPESTTKESWWSFGQKPDEKDAKNNKGNEPWYKFGYRQKTPEELAKDKKIADAIAEFDKIKKSADS